MADFRNRWRTTDWNETAEGSPELAMVQDGSRMRRIFKVRWDDVGTDPGVNDGCANDGSAQKDFVGYAEVAVLGGKRTISRKTPFSYPYLLNSAGNPWMYCVSSPVMRGVGPVGADDEGVQTFHHALLDLEFKALPWPVLSDDEVKGAGAWAGIPDEGAFASEPAKRRYVTRMVKPGGKIITLPQGMMRVVDGSANGIILREGLPFRQASAQVVYIHHLVPEEAVPFVALETQQNTINNAKFDVWSTQTLLFETADIKTMVSPLGDKIADVQMTFKWLPNVSPVNGAVRGHNYILRRAGGVLDYYLVTSSVLNGADNGTKPYQTSDFANLFRPDQ